MNENDAAAMSECTPKGVEIKIMRDLVRFHIEEQRILHANRAEEVRVCEEEPMVSTDVFMVSPHHIVPIFRHFVFDSVQRQNLSVPLL